MKLVAWATLNGRLLVKRDGKPAWHARDETDWIADARAVVESFADKAKV